MPVYYLLFLLSIRHIPQALYLLEINKNYKEPSRNQKALMMFTDWSALSETRVMSRFKIPERLIITVL